jgi:orotidine 5''-phosphate decarboxylase, subfamily 1
MALFCVALDIDNREKFDFILAETISFVDVYKVGPIIMSSSCGLISLETLTQLRKDIFVDMKFFDIPSVVCRAIRNFCRFNSKFFTVHISAGEKVFRSAVEEANKFGANIAGVTLLTSSEYDEGVILNMSEKAKLWGASWIVCPPLFARKIKENLGMKIISPGIRLDENEKDDHSLSLTPREAAKHGVDMIVVGRPVILSENPKLVAQKIRNEIQHKEL